MTPYSSRRIIVRTRGPGVVLGLFAILLSAAPAPLASQIPADTARVLFSVASDLLQEGDTTQATSLFRILLSRFPEAGVASNARAWRKLWGFVFFLIPALVDRGSSTSCRVR